ncbi:MAG TPA: iron-containing alcohol dehydrogenase [Candidatus Dormibacteraeota bacterium]|nr:iron-containing alcohol dehydrogenase [Candidatus Dormibacteraeota bacterium]
MTEPAGSFNYANPRAIHWGAGSLAQLAPELKRLQVTRVGVVTTRSIVAEDKLLGRIRGALGESEVLATEVIGQHAPMSEIEAAIEHTTGIGVDGLVSFGGGSAVDAAKVIAVKLADRHGLAYRGLPHVAIPTTLSGAELAGRAGYTDASGDKSGIGDVRLLLDSVIYDSELTLATPMSLWLSTGIRALDHAVEGFLADGYHPFSDVMALESIRRLFKSLPRAQAAPNDLGVRTENQLAAWFSFTLPGASASGLSHVMGKQIGARHRIPHGVTSCLLMPHVMRYLARTKPERMAEIAEATGSDGDAAGDVETLIGSLGLPQHIAAFGIGGAELRRAADELGGRYPAEDLLGIYLSAL